MPHYYDYPTRESRFDATLSVAKKENLLASVSEQMKIIAKPGLSVWLDNKLAEACYNQPPIQHESLKDFTKRVKGLRYQSTGNPAALGTEIHKQIEVILKGGSIDDVPDQYKKYVAPAADYIAEKGFIVEAIEQIVVNKEYKFAGTVDFIGKSKNGTPFILDWKSKKTQKGKKIQPYDENRWQLAAYAVAHYGEDRVNNHEIWAANCFVSTTEFGEDGNSRFEAFSYNPQTLAEDWKTAKLIFSLYRKVTGHDPIL